MRIKNQVMRQLSILLLSASLVVIPMSAQALGFGNIRIKSSLNEPLDAEIELLSATDTELRGLKISLASREAFLRAGIERPGHLSQLRFSIKRRSNGRAYLQITTKQSVREPFLDFLLEMNWKNGRMLREYTVLLDPPGRMQQQPTIVETPQTESPAVVAEQEKQQTETPFVEPEPAVVEEAQAQPEAAVEETPLEPAVSTEADEPIVADSIAAADVEAEPVPLAESVPEEELIVDEPAAAPESPVANTEELAVAPEAEESAEPDQPEPDPFAGEKFPRIPIKLDKQLRKAEEAELAAIDTPASGEAEPVLEETPLAAEPLAAEEPASAQAEVTPQEEALPADEELLETASTGNEAVDSVITKRNDKLWNIAESMRSDESFSIYQVMMALLQSNPDAFVDGNVHRLKVGKVLRIDDPSLISAMSKGQAAQEYIAQTRAWEEYRQQFATQGATPVQAEMAGDISESVSGEPAPEVAEEQAPSSGELVLSAPEGENQTIGVQGEQDATVNNEVVILREEIRQALAEAEAEGNKNIILNEKLRDLENQLQDLQRSVTVKDDDLATLQKQLSDLNKKNIEAEQAEEAATPHSEIPGVAATPESEVLSESEMLAQSQQQAGEPPAATEPEQATDQAETTVPPVEQPDSGPGMAEKSFGILDSIKKTLSGMVSSLPVSPLILAISGGVIVVLLLLMLLLIQRRRQAANFQESILSGIPSHEIMASEEASLETNLSGESSFLSDFAISGASALQGDDGDVDPLTEADVFMAYGRYEAAEERILEAIKKDPERQELRIKLLELYNTTKNKSAFESAAEELYANLGNDASNPLWQKVVAMGAILAADNPLFNEMPGDDATRIRGQAVASDDVLDLGSEADATTESAPVVDDLGLDLDFASESDKSAELDFDLDTGGEETAQVEKSDELDLKFDSDESLQIDTSGLDFELPTDEVAEEKTGELDLDFSAEETAQTEVSLDMDLPEDETASFSLDEPLDFDMTDVEKGVPELDLGIDASDESSMGLTLDMDVDTAAVDTAVAEKEDGMTMEMGQPTFNEVEMPTMEAEFDATDVADMEAPSVIDEVGTKLDLAKAYIDMGDPDGARSILDEVLEEGSPPQQQEAQELMQQI